MKAYRLSATLRPMQQYEFEFLAPDDMSARFMVGIFYRVCQPLTHGPLWRVGKTDTHDGIKAVYIGGEPEIVPLEIVPWEYGPRG